MSYIVISLIITIIFNLQSLLFGFYFFLPHNFLLPVSKPSIFSISVILPFSPILSFKVSLFNKDITFWVIFSLTKTHIFRDYNLHLPDLRCEEGTAIFLITHTPFLARFFRSFHIIINSTHPYQCLNATAIIKIQSPSTQSKTANPNLPSSTNHLNPYNPPSHNNKILPFRSTSNTSSKNSTSDNPPQSNSINPTYSATPSNQ